MNEMDKQENVTQSVDISNSNISAKDNGQVNIGGTVNNYNNDITQAIIDFLVESYNKKNITKVTILDICNAKDDRFISDKIKYDEIYNILNNREGLKNGIDFNKLKNACAAALNRINGKEKEDVEDVKKYFDGEKTADEKIKFISEHDEKECKLNKDYLDVRRGYKSYKNIKYDIDFVIIQRACTEYLDEKNSSSASKQSLSKTLLQDESDLEIKKQIALKFKKLQPSKNAYVFISANTNQKGSFNKTIEYQVAVGLNEILKSKGVNVFWWDDKDSNPFGWTISTKIDVALGLATTFVGLAFDSVTQKGDGYVYNCLMKTNTSDGEPYSSPNFFRDEVVTYNSLRTDKTFRKNFYKGISNIPKERNLRFYSYGRPIHKTGNGDGVIEAINGLDLIIIKSDQSSYNEKVKDVTTKVLIDLCSSDTRIKNKVLAKEGKGRNENNSESMLSDMEQNEIEDIVNYYYDAGKIVVLPGESIFTKSDASIPSDFYFDYVVLDKDCKPVNEKFTFFVTSNRGGVFVNLVINDWNDSACTPKSKSGLDRYDSCTVYYNSGITMPTEPYSGFTQKKYTRDWYDNNSGVISSFCDADDNITGCIKFGDVGKNYYIFALNFLPRNVIRYKITNEKNVFKIKFDTELPKDFHCDIVGSENGIPCLADNNIVERDFCFDNDKKGQKEYSVPKKNNRNFAYYGLRFTNELDSIFYLLENKVTLTDNADPIYNGIDRIIRKCPYCGEILGKEQIRNSVVWCNVKGEIFSRESGRSEDVSLDARNGKSILQHKGRYFCRNNYCLSDFNDIDTSPEKKLNYAKKQLPDLKDFNNYYDLPPEQQSNVEKVFEAHLKDITPNYPIALPKGIEQNTSAIVAMLGAAGTGKSVFISKLFDIKSLSSDSSNTTNVSLDYIRNSVEDLGMNVDFVYGESLPEENRGVPLGKLTPTRWKENYCSESGLMSNYKAALYNKFVARTDDTLDVADKLKEFPFILKFSNHKRNSYLSFYDVPGGRVQDGKQENYYDNTIIPKADCIIVLINDRSGKEGQNSDDRIVETTNMLEAISNLTLLNDRNLNKRAVAIVFCKFDMFYSQFDINSAVRSLSPKLKGQYNGSALQSYIDKSSMEIKEYLGSRENGKNLLAKCDNFKRLKFFAVSSVGRSDSIVGKDSDTKIRYFTSPRGIDNVIIWLAYQMGIIV
ncbi:MAG: hypothetical protein IJ706_07465 [Clostridia bacterium]|nr:hypothetical protein [Clostridia bacterium]